MKIALVYMNTEPNVGRGAGYIAGAGMQAGFGLGFFDSAFTPPMQIARKVVENQYDVLLVSAMSLVFPAALRMNHYVKQHGNMTVLVGGVHPTIVGEALLKEHHYTIIVLKTILSIGIAWPQGSVIMKNPC